MCVDGYVVAAQKRATQVAVVASAIGLVHRHHNQAALRGLNVLGGAVFDFIAGQRIIILCV